MDKQLAKLVVFIIFVALLLCGSVQAQMMTITDPNQWQIVDAGFEAQILQGIMGVQGPNTVKMKFLFDTSTGCTASSSNCTFGTCNVTDFCMPPTTAGAGLIVAGYLTSNSHITSAYLCNVSTGCTSGNADATFSLCPSSGCATWNSTAGEGTDLVYLLNAPAGDAFITINTSSTQASDWGFGAVSVLPPTGYTFSSLDSYGANFNASCQNCTLGTPTLTGTDFVYQYVDFDASPITGLFISSPYIGDGEANGACLDCSSSTAPVFSMTSAGGAAWSWMALKTTGGSYTVIPANSITVVHHAMQGLNVPVGCSPACPAFTIPSITGGNLARIAVIQNGGFGVYLSSVSGCGTWTAPSGLRETGNDIYISAAYNLAPTNGCTSITVTMTGTVTSGTNQGAVVSYWEINKTSGSWVNDTYGCTANSSGLYHVPGQTLTLNNTTANHVIFQTLADSGGVTGVTNYPWTMNGGSPSAYYGSVAGLTGNFGSDVALLNTVDGSAPNWDYPISAAATGVCADAYY